METTPKPDRMDFTDQSGWLTAFGIFELLAACFIGLTKIRSIISMAITGGNALTVYSLSLGAAGVAKRLILGYGSIQARRWARALLLVSSWFSLGIGILICPFMYWMMNHMPINTPGMSPTLRMVMSLVVTSFTFLFTVLVPLVFVLFYGREDVKRTCEWRNPNPSWTDSCPLPVLGMCLFLGLGAGYMALAAFLPQFRYPVLIWTVGGIASKIIIGLWVFSTVYAAYRLYRMSIQGLWLAAVLSGAGLINASVFYAAKGWDGFMGLLGNNWVSPKAMQTMQPIMLFLKPFIGITMMVSFAAMIAYLIFLKAKYFATKNEVTPLAEA